MGSQACDNCAAVASKNLDLLLLFIIKPCKVMYHHFSYCLPKFYRISHDDVIEIYTLNSFGLVC